MTGKTIIRGDTPADRGKQFCEEQVNEIRKKTMAPLLELKNKLDDSVDSKRLLDTESFTKIIFNFLEAIRYTQKVIWLG